MTDGKTLTIKSLSFSYGKRALLEGINLRLNRTGVYPLMGRNGAGKTTLCRLVAGQLIPKMGNILVGESPILAHKPRKRVALVSYLPQEVAIAPGIPVREVVMSGLFCHGPGPYWEREFSPRQRDILEYFHLWPLPECPWGHLSGGQKRRALVALSFLSSSPVTILDEPFSFLDPGARREVGEFICGAAKGIVLVVCHEFPFKQEEVMEPLVLRKGGLE